tara:strand:+ start:770 stop:1477 length:708 start_codon:yes stop_codon:yes gene_type:complete
MTTKLRTASFQDDAVTSAKIAADAVTAAKIPANAIGSSELDLTDNYTFTGNVAGVGSIEVISNSTTAVTGASSIEIDLDTSGDYRYQELHMHQVYQTSGGANLYMTMRDEATGSYLGSGLYSSICHGAQQSSGSNSTGDDGSWNDANFKLHWYGLGDDATYRYSHQVIRFVDVHTTAQRTIYHFTQFGNSSGAQVVVQHGAGTVLHNSKNDRCKIYTSSGTINYKGYTLYGYKRT